MGFRSGLTAKRSLPEEDIVIVMDGSGSVGECEFKEGRKALNQAIEMCEGEKNGVKYSCRHAAITNYSYHANRNLNSCLPHKPVKNSAQSPIRVVELIPKQHWRRHINFLPNLTQVGKDFFTSI